MTTYCVVNTGDNSDGTTWAKAKTSVAAGLALCAAGDVLLVSNAHTFTASAAITWTPPAGGVAILSVTPSGAAGYSAFTPGAVEAVGAANAGFAIAGVNNSSMFVYGIDMAAGTNFSSGCSFLMISTNNVNSRLAMESCTIRLPSTSTSTSVVLGASSLSAIKGLYIRSINCSFVFGSRTGSVFTFSGANMEIINPTMTFGASKPSPLIQGSTGAAGIGKVTIRDGDISSFTGAALVGVNTIETLEVVLNNLRISATPTLKTGTWTQGIGSVTLINCDSGNTIYTYQYENAFGSMVAETTDYVTTGGAQFNGAPIAWKIITTTLANEYSPFVLPPLSEWNTTLTGQTAAVEFAQVNGATALTDRQIWWGFDYPGSASFPTGSWQTNRSAGPFATTGVAHATSTNPWTVPNIGASPVTQKLQTGTATTPAAFTAAAAGPVSAQISVHNSGSALTLWVNPAIDGVANNLNQQTVWSPAGAFTKQAVAGGGGIMINPGLAGGLR